MENTLEPQKHICLSLDAFAMNKSRLMGNLMPSRKLRYVHSSEKFSNKAETENNYFVVPYNTSNQTFYTGVF